MARSRGAELLVGWRSRLQLTQMEAAVRLGLDVGTLCKLETGYETPGLERARKIREGTRGAVPIKSWPNPQPRGRQRS